MPTMAGIEGEGVGGVDEVERREDVVACAEDALEVVEPGSKE